MVVLQYDAALLQAGYKASTYLSPNHSLKNAWTSQWPINQLKQLGGNNNNYRYTYDIWFSEFVNDHPKCNICYSQWISHIIVPPPLSLPTPKKSHKSSLPQTYHHCIVMESYEDYPPSFISLLDLLSTNVLYKFSVVRHFRPHACHKLEKNMVDARSKIWGLCFRNWPEESLKVQLFSTKTLYS